MKKFLFLFWASGSLYAQTTTTRQEPKPYHPPLPDQPPAIIVKPKDALILPLPNVANSSFTGISPTASPEVAQMNSLQDVPVKRA